jgi:plastocyanin
MSKYLIILVVIVAFVSVLATGYLLWNKSVNKNLGVVIPNSKITVNAKNIPAETVSLTTSGFQPQTLTIKSGTRIIWVNNSGATGTVNSDSYPTNLLYPFLNFGQFKSGSSFSTVLNKAGTFTYYNFLNPDQRGKIIVK